MTRPLTARAGRRPATAALGLALAVTLTTGLVALSGGVPSWEEALFRWGNAGGPPEPVVWTVMQLGNLLAVPVVVLLAVAVRRVRLAAELLAAGVAAYLLARVLKVLVDRGRPAELLADVELRGAGDAGRGFPSGHAAVVAALAYVLLPHVPPRWRWGVAVVVVLVCTARVHVGAHLPLDVVGGAALGVACGSAVLLAGGRRPG